jgi:hypothetical protein
MTIESMATYQCSRDSAVKQGLDELDRGEGLEFDSIGESVQHLDRLAHEARTGAGSRSGRRPG